jgi:hypothetical protein
LNLSRNKLTQIEENDLNNMPNIEEIYLDFNELKRIRNETFTSMPKLKTISFKYSIRCRSDFYLFKRCKTRRDFDCKKSRPKLFTFAISLSQQGISWQLQTGSKAGLSATYAKNNGICAHKKWLGNNDRGQQLACAGYSSIS